MKEETMCDIKFLQRLKESVLNKLGFADLGDVELVTNIGISNYSYGHNYVLRVPKYGFNKFLHPSDLTEKQVEEFTYELCRLWVSKEIPIEFIPEVDMLKRTISILEEKLSAIENDDSKK